MCFYSCKTTFIVSLFDSKPDRASGTRICGNNESGPPLITLWLHHMILRKSDDLHIICATPIPSSIRKIDAPQFGAHLTSLNCSHPTNEKGGFMEVANLYKSNTALEIPKAKSEQERKASSCSATSIIVRYFSRHWLRGLMPRYVCFLPSLWCSTKKA